MSIGDGVLAYCFLNSANISTHHKELARATLSELKYNNINEQLKKIFSDSKFFVSDTKSEPYIKVESTDDTSPIYYQKGNFNRGSYRGCFTKAISFRNSNTGSYNRNFNIKSRKANPVKKDGEITRCNFVGQFTIGQSLGQIRMNISKIQNMIRTSK